MPRSTALAALPRVRVIPGRRVARELAAGSGLVAVLAVLVGAVPPGVALRSDLAASAATLGRLPPSASRDDVANALEPAFRGRAVTIDAASFPVAVEVTIRAIDRQSCMAAAAAHRLDGKVVVELAGYDAPAACGDDNAMTWRLTP
jgi:hypothetical protein